MDFRLLGPLEVETGGSFVRIAGAKERAVLAMLLLHANRPISRDRLVDELWGERPPRTARHTLEVYVSRLRRALTTAGNGSPIERQPGGYRIRLAEDELDVLRFERLLEEGRAALALGAAAEAETKLTAALRLWRGEVLADFAFEPFAAGEVERLDELRLAALEARAAAGFALGHHAELVGELRSLVAAHPLRERLRGQLMLGLYRAGRQADALAVYLDGRHRLVDELGIEPSHELQELQAAILRQDPSLDQPVAAASPTASHATEPTAASPQPLVRHLRKLVTVVICELSDSMALAEQLDPEALAALLDRNVARLKTIAEGHGGTVTTAIGGTVMAVFGVPMLHEDDAVRACRAATEMRDALQELGGGGRIGIATGEVIVATEERSTTGAAVQLAGELAQGAQRDEILLGAETARMLGPLIEFEPVAPLTVRGRTRAVVAFRLQRLAAPAERALARFVDRERELALLAEALRRAAEERELNLFTLLGPAGIGKSRLVREFVHALPAGTQVAHGRCLSYGKAITYWPVVEVLRALGDSARLALDRVVSGGASSPQQLAWTVQRALEQAAANRPLVVVVEDVHWAEPALLDMLDAICERSRGYPILMLCVARPELLEQRAGWGGGKLNASTLLLESLASEDSARLVDALQRPLDPNERQRVVRIAAGNPLFLEELTEFVAEGGSGDLPPRIHALLQARLDRLPEQERSVLCCAAVEGSVFHAGGLGALIPELRSELGPLLAALTRKLVVRPVPGELEEEAAFRFRHQLIRDAAYAALPKADRARLHERFADWLERHTSDRAELAELIAYHLEQAAHAKQDLGARDPVLDARAAAQLAAAGERAARRTDLRAAELLWRRSLALLNPEDPQVPVLQLELGEVLTRLGRLDDARHLLACAGEGAPEAVAAAIRLARLRVELFAAAEGPAAVRTACADLIPLFEQRGDHRALAQAWHALATAERSELRIEMAAQAYANAAEQAHGAGDLAFEAFELGLRLTMLGESRIPYAVAARELEPVAARFPGEPFLEAMLAGLRGLAAFHDGRRDPARSLIRVALDGCRRAGYTPVAMGVAVRNSRIQLVAGEIDEAERHALAAIDGQQPMDLGFLGHAKAVLAEIRIAQGRDREALQLAEEAIEPTGGPDGRMAFIVASSARARALAHLGEIERAKSVAAVAVTAAGAADSLDAQARAHAALAEVLSAAHDLPAALAAAAVAGRLYTTLRRTLERRQIAALAERIKRGIAAGDTPTAAHVR